MRTKASVKVNVVMMQKDEGDLLGAWLVYYSNLFGWSSLHILDNGSSDPKTLFLLDMAQKQGVSIYWECTSLQDFHSKGDHLSSVIKYWDEVQEYDFALPVDCDEFLVVFKDGGISSSKEDILAHFEDLKGIKQAFRIDMSLFNVPGQTGWYAPSRAFHKGFVCAYSLAGMDHGQHAPTSKFQEGFFFTRFTYLHQHNCEYDLLRQRDKAKLKGILQNPEDMEEVAGHARCIAAGAVLAQSLLLSEKEYLSQYDDDIRVRVAENGEPFLISLPEKEEGRVIRQTLYQWDEKAYLEQNPDVLGFHSTGLHHFIRHGFEEGRPFRKA